MSNNRPFIQIDPADQEVLVSELGAARGGSAFLVWFRLQREALAAQGAALSMSLSRLQFATGLARRHVIEYIHELERLRFIAVTRRTVPLPTGTVQNEPSVFRLLRGRYPGPQSEPPGSKKEPPGSLFSRPRPEQKGTDIQEEQEHTTSADALASLPASLNTAEFRTAWAAWEKHRREKRQALTPSTRTKQLAKLATLAVTDAIATIDNSIDQGYIGLFPKTNRQPTPASRPTGVQV